MDNRGRLHILDAYLHAMPPDHILMGQCEQAINHSGMHIENFLHERFSPYGLTAVWILAESHFSLHTYPEHNYISIDLYTCGGGQSAVAINFLKLALQIRSCNEQIIARG